MADQLGRILVVDDEPELLQALCETLGDANYETVGAGNAEQGLQWLEKRDFDILLSDLMMPGMDGIQLLRHALEFDPNLIGIIMTGQGTVQTAVEAMKTGAFDYLLKPFSLQNTLPILVRAMDVRRLKMENIRLRRFVERISFESPRYQMIGSGPAMQRVIQLIEKVAPTDATVLIRGPSGSGKELVARALHHNSPRRDQPMVTINCASLQESLLESELFGHEKGAFTGALVSKPGLIEVAEGGTLFIDEIGEMATGLQAKLLRVLENGNYRRVGSTKESHAHVRIIAATNKPLEEEQKAGRFREDLFYRLDVVSIAMPSLRDRREDIPALVDHILKTRQLGKNCFQIDPKALAALTHYEWPGNIRELVNVLERAQILAEGSVITIDDLPETLSAQAAPSPDAGPLNLAARERSTVCTALQQFKGNKLQAAQALGISRRALYRLIEKYHLDEIAASTKAS